VPSTLPTLDPALVPLLHGFCQHLQTRMHDWMMDEHRQLTKAMDVTMSGIRDYATKVLQGNEHAEYSLADALHKVREEGMLVRELPYTLQVQVKNSTGVPITLTVKKATAAELLDELTRLETWLAMQGYAGAGTEVVF
jgi:hypothetical protein